MWLINAHYYWLARVDLSENYSKLWCFIMVYHQHAPSENSYILRDNLHFDPFWDIATSHIVGYMYSFTFIFSLTSHWTPIVWWLIPWYPYDIICHGQSNENTMKIPFNPTKSSFSLWPHGSSHQKKILRPFQRPRSRSTTVIRFRGARALSGSRDSADHHTGEIWSCAFQINRHMGKKGAPCICTLLWFIAH